MDTAHDYDVSLPTTEFGSKVMEATQRNRTAGRTLAVWSTLLTAQGKRDEAIALLKSLMQDAEATQALRARVAQLMVALGADPGAA